MHHVDLVKDETFCEVNRNHLHSVGAGLRGSAILEDHAS